MALETAHNHEIHSVAYSPDGNLIVSDGDDDKPRFWDATSGVLKGEQTADFRNPLMNTLFSSSGSLIKTGMKLLLSEDLLLESFLSLAFSPDGNYIVSGSRDGTLQLWETRTGLAIGTPLLEHHRAVTSVAFSPDGGTIVLGSEDSMLRLRNVQTGEAVGKPMTGHQDGVLSVAFSPDGSRIVSGSKDKTLRLWDAKTGEQIGEPLTGHHDSVNSVAFSPDGRRIISDNALFDFLNMLHLFIEHEAVAFS